jgi:peptidyl-prolyl cis-trans isomerase D
LEVGAVSEPVRTDFGYHVIKLEQVRSSEVQSFDEVRDSLLTELKTTLADDSYYDLINKLDDTAFRAEDELASVAMEMGLELKTFEAFPRTGARDVFANSEAVVQAAFSEDVLLTGENSDIVELADDRVMVLRVAEYHPPTTKPLDEVREQIRNELAREKARRLAEEAANAFAAALEALPGDGDPAALAMEHNGTWTAAKWVERNDGAVPTEVLSQAFSLPRPSAGEPLRGTVGLSGGDYVVFTLSGVVSGTLDSIDDDELKRMRDIIALSAAEAELFAYSAETVADATVRVPEDVLDPQF